MRLLHGHRSPLKKPARELCNTCTICLRATGIRILKCVYLYYFITLCTEMEIRAVFVLRRHIADQLLTRQEINLPIISILFMLVMPGLHLACAPSVWICSDLSLNNSYNNRTIKKMMSLCQQGVCLITPENNIIVRSQGPCSW